MTPAGWFAACFIVFLNPALGTHRARLGSGRYTHKISYLCCRVCLSEYLVASLHCKYSSCLLHPRVHAHWAISLGSHRLHKAFAFGPLPLSTVGSHNRVGPTTPVQDSRVHTERCCAQHSTGYKLFQVPRGLRPRLQGPRPTASQHSCFACQSACIYCICLLCVIKLRVNDVDHNRIAWFLQTTGRVLTRLAESARRRVLAESSRGRSFAESSRGRLFAESTRRGLFAESTTAGVPAQPRRRVLPSRGGFLPQL